MNSLEKVTIYTDGACSGNPGPGGWAALLMLGDHKKLISGGYRYTTNNRMELQAVIEGLKTLKRQCQVEIKSDSKLITDSFNKKWIDNWSNHNWKKGPKKKDPVKNKDLWIELLSLTKTHEVVFTWVKAHSGIEENEIVDKEAVVQSLSSGLPVDEVYEHDNPYSQ
jgi:ribonuclease HI